MLNVVDLLFERTLTDFDNQSNLLLYNNNNPNVPGVYTSKSDNYMELYDAQGAHNTLEFILSNGGAFASNNINNNRNESTGYYKQQLFDIVQTYTGKETLFALVNKFFQFSNIYLQFIAFNEGQFKIINEYFFPGEAKPRKQAFIVLNGDFTICGPLFSLDRTGKYQALFHFDDMCAKVQIEQYIDKLNRTDPRSFPRIQENPISTVDQDTSNEMLVNDISAFINGFNAEIPELFTSTMEIQTSSDQITDQNTQINNTSSTLDTTSLTIQGPAASTHLPNTIQGSTTVSVSPSAQIVYDEPEIVVKPKPNWKARYPRDLILQPKKPRQRKPEKEPKYKRNPRKQTNKNENMKFIGLLQGIGSQRSRIQVKVPPRETRKLYLAATVRTINNQRHSLKFIVPEKTKVNKDTFNRENNLNYFEFDECSRMDFFDLDTLVLYMEITPEEHRKKRKKVPVYMFNLYQNQRLTKEMIEREQLDQCKLAFWLCVKDKENEKYKTVSKESYSDTIIENKKDKQNYPP